MEKDALEATDLDTLLEAIFNRYGYDFRGYARASIERRTRQFLSGSGCADVSELIARVVQDEDLFSRLVQYYSVAVTEMFRDPAVYRGIREQVVPLLRTWPHIRVWCAGCATGEEVYSLSILLKEEGLYDRVTIYATDFNDASLDLARKGVYSTERVQEATRNYQRTGGLEPFSAYYHARYGAAVMDASLRERVTFATHNLVSDGIFGEMHLILCRNVLIYFKRELQNRVLELFSDSLVYGGFLCLGSMEDIQFTSVRGLYRPVDEKARVFKKSSAHLERDGGPIG
jgi:chemotaxis protein methyltransferase CheR